MRKDVRAFWRGQKGHSSPWWIGNVERSNRSTERQSPVEEAGRLGGEGEKASKFFCHSVESPKKVTIEDKEVRHHGYKNRLIV